LQWGANAITAKLTYDSKVDLVPLLSALFTPMARRAALLLAGSGVDVLDVRAGAAPWSIALA
jgi:hypothetical protein